MQAVVLAGGLATRMRPRTLTVPKSMLEVAGRPFVDWQLERLAACGLRDVVMCVAHLGDQIRDHVGDGARFGVRGRVVRRGAEAPRHGRGDPRARCRSSTTTFLVTYGDSYLPFDYAEPLRVLAAHADCDGVMARLQERRAAGTRRTSSPTARGSLRYEKGAARDPRVRPHRLRRDRAAPRASSRALPAGEPSGLDAIQRDLAGAEALAGAAWPVRGFSKSARRKGWPSSIGTFRTRPSP